MLPLAEDALVEGREGVVYCIFTMHIPCKHMYGVKDRLAEHKYFLF